MLSSFLSNLRFIPIFGYSGLIARCNFSVANYHDDLFTEMGIHCPEFLCSAVVKRRAEYLAGRYVARQVLEKLGHGNFTLLRGEDRAPCWPVGIAGALSHNVDTALCIAQQESGVCGVGIDVETCMPSQRAADLWCSIINEQEYQWLHQQPQEFNQLLTLVFSAKESLFKALYPKVKRYFDFLDARLSGLNLQQQTFELELLTMLTAEYPAGKRFHGKFSYEGDAVITIIHP